MIALSAPRVHLPGRPATGAPLDIHVAAGGCFVLIGRSGSGKTLLCRMAAGEPPAPPLRADGLPPAGRARPGFVPQGGRENLVPGWTVRRHLAFLGVDVGVATGLSESMALDLTANLEARATELSEGMIRRLLLTLVLAGRPAALVVDEPSTGLDPAARSQLVDALRGARDDGAALLVSTHDLAVAGALGTTFGLVENGAVVARADELEADGPFAPWLGVDP